MHINIDQQGVPGLRILCEDGRRLELSRQIIDETSQKWLSDPSLLSPAMRAASAYQACSICPARRSSQICHALGPSLAFIDQLDEYDSFSPVTVVSYPADSQPIGVKQTTMQRALQYLTLLSIMEYCESGIEFEPFFQGVNPLMEPEEFADRILRNIFWESQGDLPAVIETVEKLIQRIRITCKCQIDRTRLVCKRDSLVNAYIATMTIADFLSFRLHDLSRPTEACCR